MREVPKCGCGSHCLGVLFINDYEKLIVWNPFTSSVHAGMTNLKCWEKRGPLLYISLLMVIQLLRRLQRLNADHLLLSIFSRNIKYLRDIWNQHRHAHKVHRASRKTVKLLLTSSCFFGQSLLFHFYLWFCTNFIKICYLNMADRWPQESKRIRLTLMITWLSLKSSFNLDEKILFISQSSSIGLHN